MRGGGFILMYIFIICIKQHPSGWPIYLSEKAKDSKRRAKELRGKAKHGKGSAKDSKRRENNL